MFSGTKSFSKIARKQGHQIFTVDNDHDLFADLVSDVRYLTAKDFPFKPDILWCSPPCQGFSVAVIGRNWNYDKTPKTNSARLAIELIEHTLRIIEELKPTWYFIENPTGMLRKMPQVQSLNRKTVTNCQYGDTRMKPTDIWTNATWWSPRPPCKNGMICHEAAPRGSRTGTQGIKGARDRGRIPPDLFVEMFQQWEQTYAIAA